MTIRLKAVLCSYPYMKEDNITIVNYQVGVSILGLPLTCSHVISHRAKTNFKTRTVQQVIVNNYRDLEKL
ncbi:hypothetical protein Molly5_41 [Maribacter phage Molly_5]|uniref:Uncharacterized protein n=2 Tax=Mollyvirus TaxID=2948826 RepID=A0A8E4XXV3_9CAUD|nr:hypothetical protein M1M29_gp041 [Maribacter phage Molly_1]YP_010357289.1 hypothetical protein M1M30_gp040 [Maribacter phage Colly_1]QQO97724.1 hypothetical protein Molly2_41 [Maribacter phage Molly_2]QQO97924.1 hypothetical protein Molly3_41 [Maribacter phage Molly_3]QQO98124.1 hypothetical protein Molly4_41 [Maribacter phage Molly_4]QQO98324.1 hypothetical protein Molly5_41 [Maribacter phage Molly_5]QQO97323.1 hypothetical protein Colly1_40 [Maribacter phage Colly_1]